MVIQAVRNFFSKYIFILWIIISARPLFADSTLSGQGGVSLGSGPSSTYSFKTPSISIGAEYTFKLFYRFEFGGFYDRNFMSNVDGTWGALQFFGTVIRYNFSNLRGFFIDSKLGVTQTLSDTYISPLAFGVGLGTGYRVPIGKAASFSPRIGVRFLSSSTIPNDPAPMKGMADITFMFSMHF